VTLPSSLFPLNSVVQVIRFSSPQYKPTAIMSSAVLGLIFFHVPSLYSYRPMPAPKSTKTLVSTHLIFFGLFVFVFVHVPLYLYPQERRFSGFHQISICSSQGKHHAHLEGCCLLSRCRDCCQDCHGQAHKRTRPRC